MTRELLRCPGRWRYLLNGVVLLAPVWFFYQALDPELPVEWPERGIGPFTAAPMPLDHDPPYPYEDGYLKDFSVRFCAGCMQWIRLAYLSVGTQPVGIPEDVAGILHGTGDVLHVHAPFPSAPGAADSLWLTVQEWNGRVYYADWPLQYQPR